MRAYLPFEIVHAISLPTWHRLFAARGYPPGVTPKTTSHAAIAAALRDADVPTLLARAIFAIRAFETEAGRTDIYSAATGLAFPQRWPDTTSPADLVAHLLALAVTDAAVAEILAAAKIIRDRSFRPRTTLLYVARPKASIVLGDPSQYIERWTKALEPLLALHDFGPVVAVHVFASPGVVSYEVVHEGRRESAKTRPLVSHLIAHETRDGNLVVTTAYPELARPLARLAGNLYFDDPDYFLVTAAVDLWKLQELGAGALTLPELAHKITAKAIGGTWDSGKTHAVSPRGKDFFKALARYKIRIEGGRIDLLSLRAQRPPVDGGPSESDVALRPPHQMTIAEPEFENIFRELLDAAGITSPEPRERDFYADQPWRLGAPGWIANEGTKGFQRLVRRGILKADESNRAIAPPGDPLGARTAIAYRLPSGKYLAWSADRSVEPFLVEAPKLVVYVLKWGKFAKAVATELSLEEPATKLDEDGILRLGHREIGPTHVHVYLPTRPLSEVTIKRLAEAARHGHAVLVVPSGRVRDIALRQIAMPKLSESWHSVLGDIVRAFRLEAVVETTVYAPPDARVVYHRATTRLWVDKVLCTAVNGIQLRLAEYMVEHAGQMLHTKDVAEHLGQGQQHVDTTRHAFKKLIREIVASFVAAKKKPPADLEKIFVSPKNGIYMLNAKGFVD